MSKRVLLAVVLLWVGGCGNDGPNADTESACRTFRDLQATDDPADEDVIQAMQQILGSDASASVQNGARDIAIALESNATSTEVQDAIRRLDAGCLANDL